MKKTVNKKVLICFSTSGYDAEIWTNKQHLTSRLDKLNNYKVIYIDQGMSLSYIRQKIKSKDWKYFYKPVQKRGNDLYVVSPFFLPLIKGGVFKKMSWLLLSSIISVLFSNRELLLWIYQPQAYYFLKYFKNRGNLKTLYDCVDEFKTQPFYKNSKSRKAELEIIEDKLSQQVDYITTTSYGIYEDKIKLNAKTKYIHNVGDFEHFSKPDLSISIDESWITDSRIKVLFTGVVDNYKTDLTLIREIAIKKVETHYFVFVGPVRIDDAELEKEISSLNNVSLLGLRPYKTIPTYLKNADILWLPYKKTSHTDRVFPLKMFEYLASGKPVLVKNLASLNEYGKYVEVFSNFNNLELSLENILASETNDKVKRRISIAKENTWESRLKKILDFIRE